ncbi:pentatricopeptide repeat-containing protein At2g35030, mitochondrial isoform X1 [Tripterygium wilfordii]|uniref:pentatricopeptide repeat-containing protein At2g35030, mitochondrial isoform X1 n=1 Tax=Tripterygium wilfordii TaxID=458696 RepID=UPI0018F8098B|nr:pentatricopeptide repeat-containing protein At2g35030, mitochondrial isoform X1 [Tripterygium wilfordii]
MMPKRNIVSWNAMVIGLAGNGRTQEAREVFEMMPDRNIISCTAMVTGLASSGRIQEAREVFEMMPERNIVAWTAMVTGLARNGRIQEAREVFEMMPERDVFSWNAMVTGLTRNGRIEEAREVFEIMPERDVVSWNCMMTAYAHHGCGREAINIFHKMQDIGLKPNDMTYVGLLTACNHDDLVEEALKFFNQLVNDTSIKLREDHLTCLVNLCSRAGRLKDAVDPIKRIGSKQSSFLWRAAFAKVHFHGDVKPGS